MFYIVLITLFVIINGYIAYQDFRYRAVYWWLFPALLFISLGISFSKNTLHFIIEQTIWNAAFIALQLFCLWLYWSFKHRKMTNFINQGLGIGDILFWVVILPLFELPFFVVYYFLSLLTSLLFIVMFFRKNLHQITIPLAGLQSLQLILFYFLVNSSFLTVFG